MFKKGTHKEKIARAADAAGHAETATSLYYAAIEGYRHGQHAIFEGDDPEKIFLHGRMSSCYDRIIALSGGRIARVEIDLEGNQMSGLLHLAPHDDPAPLIVFCPAMDMTKEAQAHQSSNPFARCNSPRRDSSRFSCTWPG